MPLLHRRSVFDPLSSPERDTSHNRPGSNASLAPPTSPRPVSEYARPTSRPSTAMDHTDRPTSPTVQPENARTKRFSMLKFRTYSESHLSARAKQDAAKEIIPPMPALSRGEIACGLRDRVHGGMLTDVPVNTPAIVKTAPTLDHEQITATKQCHSSNHASIKPRPQ